MVDQVDRLTIQDGISGPMKAAEDQLRRTADAADVVEKTVTRVGASAKTLVNRYDDATRMARTLEKAQRDLASSIDVRTRDAYAKGLGTSLDLVTSGAALRQSDLNLAVLQLQAAQARVDAVLSQAECLY